MPIAAAAILGGATLAGGLMAGSSAKSAANTSANAQIKAAEIAAEASKFRPVGVTTGFGKSRFTLDDKGNLTEAGYELTPDLQAIRDYILNQAKTSGMDMTTSGLEASKGLFDLGKGYVSKTPEEAAKEWLASQQAALAPSRDLALSNVMNKLTNTGTLGLGVAQGGSMGTANPLMQAFANAVAKQDLELAGKADEYGMNRVKFGQGLLGGSYDLAKGAYSPLSSMLNAASGIEGLGKETLDTGAALGGRVTAGSSAAGSALARGMENAAATMAPANAYNPMASALMSLGQNKDFGNWASGLFSSGPAASTSYTPTSYMGSMPVDYSLGSSAYTTPSLSGW
jgi:hypothetical protein